MIIDERIELDLYCDQLRLVIVYLILVIHPVYNLLQTMADTFPKNNWTDSVHVIVTFDKIAWFSKIFYH